MEPVKHLKRACTCLSRWLSWGILPLRFLARRFRPPSENLFSSEAVAASIPVHVINLATRRDRLHETHGELSRMGISEWSRFDAVKSEDGAIGCALSHARVLEGLGAPVPAVMVCEDDVEFLVGRDELRAVLVEFMANPALDVLCLAFRLGSKPHSVSPRLAITSDTQTAACYIAKGRAQRLLSQSFSESAELIKRGKPRGLAAADQHWKKLQRRALIFAVPHNRAVRQRPSFSDIEGRNVAYGL